VPVFELKPWGDNIEFEVCGTQFCFELKDREHRVHIYYEEYNDKKGEALMVDLQKKEGYKEYVKKFIEFDLPSISMDGPNEKNAEFYTAYKSALDLYNEGKRASVYTKWEDDDISIALSIMMWKRVIDLDFSLNYGPYRLHYNFNAQSKQPQVLLAHRVEDAVGMWMLFKEYVKK
jgi:hypothetical protein